VVGVSLGFFGGVLRCRGGSGALWSDLWSPFKPKRMPSPSPRDRPSRKIRKDREAEGQPAIDRLTTRQPQGPRELSLHKPARRQHAVTPSPLVKGPWRRKQPVQRSSFA